MIEKVEEMKKTWFGWQNKADFGVVQGRKGGGYGGKGLMRNEENMVWLAKQGRFWGVSGEKRWRRRL
jgi:hypothetical protein